MSWAVSEARRKTKLRAVEYKGGKCEDCGYNRCAAALIFHHRDPKEKEFQISGKTLAWAKVVVELDKTVLLCSNCHAERHSTEDEIVRREREVSVRALVPEHKYTDMPLDDVGFPHGSSYGYGRGCRCTSCRTANTERNRKYKHRDK